MIIIIKADRASGPGIGVVANTVTVPARQANVIQAERTVRVDSVRGIRIIVKARLSRVGIPVTGFRASEVFVQETDPVVNWPALNFKLGQFPAYPEIATMLVFKP